MENIEAAMKRIPPHSTEAEQAVLGAMLMNKDAITVTSEILAGQDFYQTAYGILFDAMTDLFKSGRPVDLITLQEYLKTKDVPPEVSSMEFARDLLVGTQTSANVKYYAEIVKEKSVLRSLIKLNEETANACYLENEPLDELLERTEKRVFELAENDVDFERRVSALQYIVENKAKGKVIVLIVLYLLLAVLVILNAYVEKYSVGLCVLSGGIALVGVYFAILHIVALTKMK